MTVRSTARFLRIIAKPSKACRMALPLFRDNSRRPNAFIEIAVASVNSAAKTWRFVRNDTKTPLLFEYAYGPGCANKALTPPKLNTPKIRLPPFGNCTEQAFPFPLQWGPWRQTIASHHRRTVDVRERLVAVAGKTPYWMRSLFQTTTSGLTSGAWRLTEFLRAIATAATSLRL